MNTTIPNALAAAAACPSEGSINTEFLQSLVGFNARMASLHLIDTFMHAVAEHGLRVVDFSILSVVGHNAGITSSQLCACLNLLPPNLVAKVRSLEKKRLAPAPAPPPGWPRPRPAPDRGRANPYRPSRSRSARRRGQSPRPPQQQRASPTAPTAAPGVSAQLKRGIFYIIYFSQPRLRKYSIGPSALAIMMRMAYR